MPIVTAPRLAPTEATRRWAALLQQIFEVDPLACPTCHGTMRIVAFITQASVIDQILTHLRTRVAAEDRTGARSPPSTRLPAAVTGGTGRDATTAGRRPPRLLRSPASPNVTPANRSGPRGDARRRAHDQNRTAHQRVAPHGTSPHTSTTSIEFPSMASM
jgi:hypothetical protein